MNRNRNAARNSLTAAATLAVAVAAVGCSYDEPNSPQYNAFQRNLTPELDTLTERPDDVDNQLTRTLDVNGRLLWEDLGRFWLVDHPSRLSRSHIVD